MSYFSKLLMVICCLLPGCAANSKNLPELFAPDIVSTEGFQLGIAFLPDRKEVYFSEIGEGFSSSVIMVSREVDQQWQKPERISFAGKYRDLDVNISPDGNFMFFQSDRPLSGDKAKDWDIWISRRGPDGWEPPYNPGAPLNTDTTETFPISAGGKLYFSSDRTGGLDIYSVDWHGEVTGVAEPLPTPLNTEQSDSNAFMEVGENFMIISSDAYPDHLGAGDLYIHLRQEGHWTPAIHLPFLNTSYREFAPSVSPDGQWLYFTSNRPRDEQTEPVKGDIYRIKMEVLLSKVKTTAQN